jgi:NADPH:quinone reductase-like Zn-dependent oxidoreductase
MDVHAAVVRSVDFPPRYETFELPGPADGQALIDVLAVGLHPRVRTGAAGRHYTSTGKLPMVPGIDGVGRRDDGQLVYFIAADELVGPMATRTVIDTRRSLVLPEDADVAKIAAAMNPAMSAWVALRRRVPIQAGQSVLVLGATGSAGRMAVQVARRLGAGRIVGAGRDQARLATLAGLGADATVALGGDADASAVRLAEAASEVDIVIDYLWGNPASAAMTALLRARADRGRALNWIQIGSVAGPTIELPSVALRSANVRLQGSGQGAVSTAAYLAELPSLIDEINNGGIAVTTCAVALADVETAWLAPEIPGVRTVLMP